VSSGAVTQTTSVSHLEDQPRQRPDQVRTSEGKSLSLEERRKVGKYRKNLEKIKLKQQQVDQQLQMH